MIRSAGGVFRGSVMANALSSSTNIENGDYCLVVSGTHAGKSGLIQDRKTSKTGHVTITVQQANGVRFKTLARNVSKQS